MQRHSLQQALACAAGHLLRETRDGLVDITNTWKRERIKHVAIDPAKLKPMTMADGSWPKELQSFDFFDRRALTSTPCM